MTTNSNIPAPGLYILMKDVGNPNVDKRYKTWTRRPKFKAGTVFELSHDLMDREDSREIIREIFAEGSISEEERDKRLASVEERFSIVPRGLHTPMRSNGFNSHIVAAITEHLQPMASARLARSAPEPPPARARPPEPKEGGCSKGQPPYPSQHARGHLAPTTFEETRTMTSITTALLVGTSAVPSAITAKERPHETRSLLPPHRALFGLSRGERNAHTMTRVRSGFRFWVQENPEAAEGLSFSPADVTMETEAPDEMRNGVHLDLAIAVALLGDSLRDEAAEDDDRSEEAFMRRLSACAFFGELSLAGNVRVVCGVLPMLQACKDAGSTHALVPEGNFQEASLVEGIEVHAVRNLSDVVQWLRHPLRYDAFSVARGVMEHREARYGQLDGLDFNQVKGLTEQIEALTVAAAGRHSVLMIGEPGSGATMLARRLNTILPDMTHEESLDVTGVYSIAGLLPQGEGLIERRPFRAPHHTISRAGMFGGGHSMRPGEASLSHRGVLFLDEVTEFNRDVFEPVVATGLMGSVYKDITMTHTRSWGVVEMKAHPAMVVASAPACPCGTFRSRCICHERDKARHRKHLARLMPLFDIIIYLPHRVEQTHRPHHPESSASIRERVTAVDHVEALPLHDDAEWSDESDSGWRIRRVAETLAKLEGVSSVTARHLAAARCLTDGRTTDECV